MTALRTIVLRATPMLVLALLAAGCGQLRAASSTPPVPLQWQLEATLHDAEREALAARFSVADRLLADFATRHADSPEAMEAGFWRALFKLDSANPSASPREAVTLLDAYLLGPATTQHRGSATALRRVAVALERPAPALVASPANPPGAPAARTEQRADERRDEEVQRLREELAKANAELERIKRRLAQPAP